jgi:REP element-mobilizing transposase RayT
MGDMRKPRELEEGARYHVTARANRKEMIFDTIAMKDIFLSVVKRAKAKYDFRLENFCVMGNHFHFVIQPGRGASLSAIMRWILSVFAVTFNKINGITGHVWGCRFFSRIIAGLRELLQVFEYIDENPVRANQVQDRREWHWGGLWHNRTGCRDIVDAPEAWFAPYIADHSQLFLTK